MDGANSEELEKIISFLYWEEEVEKGFLSVERIQYETGLTRTQVQRGLKTLGHSGLVDYVYQRKDVGIEEARITPKGKKKADRFNE